MTEVKGQLTHQEIIDLVRADREDPTLPLTDFDIALMMEIYLNDYKEQLLNSN